MNVWLPFITTITAAVLVIMMVEDSYYDFYRNKSGG